MSDHDRPHNPGQSSPHLPCCEAASQSKGDRTYPDPALHPGLSGESQGLSAKAWVYVALVLLLVLLATVALVPANLRAVVVIVAIALVFDYVNGFHDSANSVATLVATGVVTPQFAVIWAAIFNFVAIGVLGIGVAETIAKTLDPSVATKAVIFSALMAAIAWNLITWWTGIPSSSSHALVGGLVGAGCTAAGFSFSVINWEEVQKPLIGIVLAPTLSLVVGFGSMLVIVWVCRNFHPAPLNWVFRKLQLVSSALYSISHGGNDAQKTIGIIAALLVSEGYLQPAGDNLAGTDIWQQHAWIIFAAFFAIALGTISGGWRIVKTMGTKITKLRPVDGFAAATAAGTVISVLTLLRMPVSTTHSIAGSIMGVGAAKSVSAVHWAVSARILWAWILTIPCSALLAVACYLVAKALGAT
jgi:PiT family inorganic phosphate transporter